MNHHPPKPPLALAVGIIGHRPNRLAEAARAKVAADIEAVLTGITAAMGQALTDHAEVYSGKAVLALVDSLAEGADRIAARALAAEIGKGEGPVSFVLDAVLPFTAEEFGKDFAEEPSRSEFLAFLAGARAVLELPGSREAEASAYEAAAYTVVDQSDVVIAVWDGGPSGGRGGTTDTVEAAARDGRPLVIVDANGKEPPQLRWHGLNEEIAPTGRVSDIPTGNLDTALPLLVDALVRPPAGVAGGARHRPHHEEDEGAGLTRYFAEGAAVVTPFLGFPLLMAAFGIQRLSGRHVRPVRPAALAVREVALAPAAAADAPAAARPLRLADAFGWADFIGSLFAQVFRSAFIVNFVFGALAVACAAISIVRHDWKPVLVVIEILLIVAVVINTGLGLRRQWHRRWFEGRELAERLRVALLLWVVGLRPSACAGAEPTWTGWYARAEVRAQGLRHARLTGGGLAAAHAAVSGLLNDQCAYHKITADRMHLLEHRLERAGLVCFVLTVAVALIYLAVQLTGLAGDGEGAERFAVVVAALTAGLPALATATYGIRVIGDFAGISRRSERTRSGLAALVAQIDAKEPNLHHLRARVRAAAGVMLGDVAGWRLSAESRGLALPG